MEAAGAFETLENFYQTARIRNIAVNDLHSHHLENVTCQSFSLSESYLCIYVKEGERI
jgi:hypothetical protein